MSGGKDSTWQTYAMKDIQHMKPLAVVAAGSNLGVIHGEEAFPVGQVEMLSMYPMNFEEFLLGTDEPQAVKFLEQFQGEKTGEPYHRKLFHLSPNFNCWSFREVVSTS